jgi:hypothetical protein
VVEVADVVTKSVGENGMNVGGDVGCGVVKDG